MPASKATGSHPSASTGPAAKAQADGYVVLARKYRPQTFDDIVGQEGVQQALRGAIATGQISHSYLFSGPRGTGKTSTARILAKAVNCMDNGPRPDPCGQCSSCRSITAGSSLDVIEIDAASNTGVDNIRELKSGIVLAPFSRYKVYIVDEVHMLSNQAFNALLKTLEEPPPQVIFVLATTELHKVPETIISRCQTFMFRRFSLVELKDQLGNILDIEMKARELTVDPEDREKILDLIARSAEGGMRDAQVTLDQVLVLSKQTMTFESVRRFLGMADTEALDLFVKLLHDSKSKQLLELIDSLATSGQDLELFIKGACEHMRDLLLIKCAGTDTTLINVSEDRGHALQELASGLSAQFLVNAVDQFLKTAGEMKMSGQPRIVLELAVLKLTLNNPENSISGILERLDALEKQSQAPAARSAAPQEKPAVKEALKANLRGEPQQAPVAKANTVHETPARNYIETNESENPTSHPSPVSAPAPGREFSDADEMASALGAQISSEAPMLKLAFEKVLCGQKFDGRSLTLLINSRLKMPSTQIMRQANTETILRIARGLFGDNVVVRLQLKEEELPERLSEVGGVSDEPAADDRLEETSAPISHLQSTEPDVGPTNQMLQTEPIDSEPLKIYYPEEIREKTMLEVKDSEFQHMLQADAALKSLVEKTKRAFGIEDNCLKFHRSTLA